MLLKRNSVNFKDENFLTGKTEAKIVISAANLNIFLENVFKTSTKTSHHHMTITAKSLRQQKLSL